eukprot:406547_1
MFHPETNTTQQRVAVYCLLCASIGGLILANTEVYISPSFSNKSNLFSHILHLFGAFCYGILGNLAFAMYNNWNWTANGLFFSTILILIVFRINRVVQSRGNVDSNSQNEDYTKWVHNMSRVNIALEVVAISLSIIAMSALVYQFGYE